MLTNLKRGTRVVTAAGIIGTIVSVKDTDDEMTIRSEDARLKVLKSSVVKILGSDEAEAAK
jgi:preprotein translocase YajC subunit